MPANENNLSTGTEEGMVVLYLIWIQITFSVIFSDNIGLFHLINFLGGNDNA